MKDKYLGYALLTTVALTLYAVIFAPENGGLQTLIGLMFVVFVPWGGIRLVGKE